MPISLDQFIRASQNHSTKEIYVNGPEHATSVRTRNFVSQRLVSVFKSGEATGQRASTAHAFVAALQERITAKTALLRNVKPEVKQQYLEDTEQIVLSLKSLLANQLSGRSALTANDIQRAVNFVDETLALADAEKGELDLDLRRSNLIDKAEAAVLGFYQRDAIEDISLSDDAVRAKAETALATRGLHVAHRAPEQTARPQSMARLLGQYLNAKSEEDRPKLDFDTATRTLEEVSRLVREVASNVNSAAQQFEALEAGEQPREHFYLDGITPGSDEAKSHLNTFRALSGYAAPMYALQAFLKKDVAEMQRERFLESKSLTPGSRNEPVSNERSVAELLDEFQSGTQLSDADLAFLSLAAGSKEMIKIVNTMPSYKVSSTSGPSMAPMLEAVSKTPNSVWQAISNQEKPAKGQIIYSESEKNPWALFASQALINHSDEVHDLSKAVIGLQGLLDLVSKSHGNLAEAERLAAAGKPAHQSHHPWKAADREVNTAAMQNANTENIADKANHPELFERGLNRELRIDPDAVPRRPGSSADGQYTHAYDDDPNSGRAEASTLREKPAAASPTAAGGAATKSSDGVRAVVDSNAQDLSVIDIDLSLEKTNRAAFEAWLANKVKTTPHEALWAVLPTLARNGHLGRVARIESAIKIELASRALTPNREALNLDAGRFKSLVELIAARAVSDAGSDSKDPYAKISLDRVKLKIADSVTYIASGVDLEDDFLR